MGTGCSVDSWRPVAERGEEWKLWRDAPGFSQRSTGTFNADGNTITGSIESSRAGAHWEHDFDLTYTKVEANNAAQARPVQAPTSTH